MIESENHRRKWSLFFQFLHMKWPHVCRGYERNQKFPVFLFPTAVFSSGAHENSPMYPFSCTKLYVMFSFLGNLRGISNHSTQIILSLFNFCFPVVASALNISHHQVSLTTEVHRSRKTFNE